MRIAIHIDGKTIRGSEVQTLLVAREMRARGHAVVVSCRDPGPVAAHARALQIATTGIRPRGDADMLSALRFSRWLRQNRFDVVLLTSWKKAFIASLAARMARAPHIVLRVGGVHRVRAGLTGWKYRRALSRYIDAVVCNSGAVAGMIHETAPALPLDRVHIVMNGLAGWQRARRQLLPKWAAYRKLWALVTSGPQQAGSCRSATPVPSLRLSVTSSG